MYAIKHLKNAVNAWCWRVSFRRSKKLYEKSFYEIKLGGEKPALEAAIAWRDKKLQSVKALTKREFHAQKRSNNTSGMPGVHKVKATGKGSDRWQAKITRADGSKTMQAFSIAKYGDRKAFKMAVAARKKMLEQIDDKPYLHDATATRFEKRKSFKP